MSLQCAYQPYTLQFRFEAGTSRGKLTEKKIWLIRIREKGNDKVCGTGEISPLAGLSMDAGENYDEVLKQVALELEHAELPQSEEKCLALAAALSGPDRPALRFGLETALLDLWTGGNMQLFKSAFTAGKEEIPINGLIWMGSSEFMRSQVREKTNQGFTCIKMKIGAIDFDTELSILRQIREQGAEIVRVDANGAFNTENVDEKLQRLAELDLHSIEQPIPAGNRKQMARVCRNSPVPVALDEELIGIGENEYGALLDELKPPFIIIKPSLLGGIKATRNWIMEAENRGIGWWITSALESNIGLNAIAQLTAILHYSGHQGLGTGQLYENNFDSPMKIRHGHLYYDSQVSWNFEQLEI